MHCTARADLQVKVVQSKVGYLQYLGFIAGARNRRKATVKIRRIPQLRILPLIQLCFQLDL